MRRILIIVMVWMTASVLSAQTVKTLTVSNNVPVTDTPTLKNAPEGTQPTATFLFDEQDNTLTVTLQAGCKLFVFWEDVPFHKAFQGHRLRTDRLPYVLTGNTSDTYRRDKKMWKALPRPFCRYVFKRWAEADDLQAIAAERKIQCDSVTQTFILPERSTEVIIRLGDVLLLNDVAKTGISHRYELTYAGDVNTEYKITLQRNACLRLADRIDAADKALAAVKQSYQALEEAYPKHTVTRQEDLDMFNQLKNALLLQFASDNDSTDCTQLTDLRAQCKQYADSIQAFSVTLNIPIDPLTNKARKLDVKLVLYNTRLLDSNVSRMLSSHDPVEQSDLKEQCRRIVEDTNELIKTSSVQTKDEQDAVRLFRDAERYFGTSCR